MKHLKTRKKTVAVFWIISYLLLILISLIGNIHILTTVHSAINEEIKQKYSYFLRSMGSNIDMHLKDINSVAYAVSMSKSIRDIAGRDDTKNPEYLYALKETADEVEKICAGYSNDLNVFVYFPKTDMIIFKMAYASAEDFFSQIRAGGKYSAAEYIDILSKGEIAVVKDEISVNGYTPMVSYRFINPIGASYGANAVVFVEISEKDFFGNYFDTDKNDIAVLSRRNDVYLSSCNIGDEIISVVKKAKETDTIYTKLNGETVGISYIKSDIINSYKYVFIDRSENLYSVSGRVMTVGIAVSLISLLLMMIILYKLFGWNYIHIKDIMNTLSDEDIGDKTSENEFEIIKSRITAAKNRRNEMEREADSRFKALKEEFIADILTGTSGDADYIEEQLKKYDIVFDGNYFCVSVLKIQHMGVLENLPLKNACYVIQNIMDDMLKKESYLSCEYNGFVFYIFSFRSPDKVYEHLSSILTESCEVTKMASEIVFISATSELAEGLSSLPQLYESALSVLNLSEFYGMEDHVFRRDLDNQIMECTPIYSANTENEIIVSIKACDKKSFFNIVDKLFNKYVLVNHEWVFLGLAYSILNSILKVIDMSGTGKTEEAFRMLNSFRDYNNIDKIKEFVKDYGIHAMEIFSSEKEEKAELYEKAIDYINRHYTECDLNVATVSEKLGVTSIYLAYIMKQNSGLRLSEYIAKLRVDKAKSLLDGDVNMNVEKIAELSGFLSSRTFYNTFKKYTGITPTQYRMIKNNE